MRGSTLIAVTLRPLFADFRRRYRLRKSGFADLFGNGIFSPDSALFLPKIRLLLVFSFCKSNYREIVTFFGRFVKVFKIYF